MISIGEASKYLKRTLDNGPDFLLTFYRLAFSTLIHLLCHLLNTKANYLLERSLTLSTCHWPKHCLIASNGSRRILWGLMGVDTMIKINFKVAFHVDLLSVNFNATWYCVFQSFVVYFRCFTSATSRSGRYATNCRPYTSCLAINDKSRISLRKFKKLSQRVKKRNGKR